MGITGSIIVYVIIWWIIFFSFCLLVFNQKMRNLKKNYKRKRSWSTKKPKNCKKVFNNYYNYFINKFIVIYYLVNNNLINLRNFYNNVFSKLFIPITKDLPSEAKIKSHQLMLQNRDDKTIVYWDIFMVSFRF